MSGPAERLIPRRLHFVFGLRDRELAFFQFLAMVTATRRNPGWRAYLHSPSEPIGPWWCKLAGVVRWRPLDARSLSERYPRAAHYAHLSDVARLEVLRSAGGVYLDLDTVTFASFEALRRFQTVMARQGRRGLCNAFVAARPHARFLERWLKEYDSFDPRRWDEHSVLLPARLSRRPALKSRIHVLSTRHFFYPSWDNGLDELLRSADRRPFARSLGSHLWFNLCRAKLVRISPTWLLASRSVYAQAIREVVPAQELERWSAETRRRPRRSS
jgi:hypothetical protein